MSNGAVIGIVGVLAMVLLWRLRPVISQRVREWLVDHPHLYFVVHSPQARKIWPDAMRVVLTLLVLSALVMYFATTVFGTDNERQQSYWNIIARSPGAFFVVALATITAWGFLFTVTRLHEVMGRINTYSELLVKAGQLLEEELRLASDNDRRTIWFVCTTPLNGNVSANHTPEYKFYVKNLHIAEEKLTFNIIRPPMVHVRRFYDRFKAPASDVKEVDSAYQQTVDFFELIAETAKQRDADRTRHRFVPASHTIRHLLSDVNEEIGYRFILSRQKAIFYVPLFLPPSSADHSAQDLPNSQRRAAKRVERVEMFGFETTDRFVLEQLQRNYAFLEEKSIVGGAEEFRKVSVNGGVDLEVSHMAALVPRPRKEAVLWLHGLTTCMRDEKWHERLVFRDRLAKVGLDSFEFNYRWRGCERKEQTGFSLSTAVEDADGVLRYLYTQAGYDRVWVMGRGMAAYIALTSSETGHYKCPLVLWQPIFCPLRTMAARGHVKAYNDAYSSTVGHKYVEVEGVRLGPRFFESLRDATPDTVWEAVEMHVLCTGGDKVAHFNWIEEFLHKVIGDTVKTPIVSVHQLDKGIEPADHLHESSSAPFVDKTIEIVSTRDRIQVQPTS